MTDLEVLASKVRGALTIQDAVQVLERYLKRREAK